MFYKDTKIVKYIISIAALALLAISYTTEFHRSEAAIDLSTQSRTVILSQSRINHILEGDGQHGGHRHGTGTPCKSEFPASWDDAKIIKITKMIAANDNLPWDRQRNGYHVSEFWVEGVNVRVVLGQNKERVITSYPINVPRNPCPAEIEPANDN